VLFELANAKGERGLEVDPLRKVPGRLAVHVDLTDLNPPTARSNVNLLTLEELNQLGGALHE
jgi:hypothetical protein